MTPCIDRRGLSDDVYALNSPDSLNVATAALYVVASNLQDKYLSDSSCAIRLHRQEVTPD